MPVYLKLLKTEHEIMLVIVILLHLHSLETGEVCPPFNYNGSVSVTNGGRKCQHWSNQVPHAHIYTNSSFPLDGSIEEAANYCRQLDGDRLPWCYTTDIYVRWQYCEEIICGVSGPQCGGKVTASNGTLGSIDRNGDNIYDNNRDCLWKLVAPADRVIELNILTFDLEEEPTCVYDLLLVYEDSLVHGMYCGTEAPSTIKSLSQILYVRFRADKELGFTGFTANYSHVLPSLDEDGEWEENSTTRLVNYGETTCPADVNILLYAGEIHTTNSGTACLDWSNLGVPDYLFLVDKSAAAAKNYCRNIMGSALPLCFSSETYPAEYCTKQICPDAASVAGTTITTVTTNVTTATTVNISLAGNDKWIDPTGVMKITPDTETIEGLSTGTGMSTTTGMTTSAGRFIGAGIQSTDGLSTGTELPSSLRPSATRIHSTDGLTTGTELPSSLRPSSAGIQSIDGLSTGTELPSSLRPSAAGIQSTDGLSTRTEVSTSLKQSSGAKLCHNYWLFRLLALVTIFKM